MRCSWVHYQLQYADQHLHVLMLLSCQGSSGVLSYISAAFPSAFPCQLGPIRQALSMDHVENITANNYGNAD